MTIGTMTTAASRPKSTATYLRLAQTTAAKKRKTTAAVHGSHVTAGAGVSSHPNTPIISL